MSSRNKKRIFTIILINHDKQLETIRSEETEEKIYKRFNKMLKENQKVIFPRQYNNHYHKMVEAKYELVIIKCKQFGDSDINKVKNEYGEYVDYGTNNEDWIVIDRANYNIEETFWVYGYHPKLQRKTFSWVFDNIILKDYKNKSVFKSVQVYLNKILIDNNGKLEIVICKNQSDAIRFYNLIEAICRKKRLKRIILMGDLNKSAHKQTWIERIKKTTNWNDIKVKRRSTRP